MVYGSPCGFHWLFLIKGGFGVAVLVKCKKTGKLFVIKEVMIDKMSESELAEAKKEVQVLSSLEHPNIVSYRESFVERRKLCIVMGFADGGDLCVSYFILF